MSKRRAVCSATRIRRAVQVVFLLVFLGLVLFARPRPGVEPSPLLKSFFLIDPLILIFTWLAAHAVPATLLLSLILVAMTVVLGRVFCGWACPLGTIHDIAGRFFDWVQGKRKTGDHWSPWQRSKYYLLIGLLAMAVFGGHWACIMDPLVLLYRTTTVVLFPATQWAVEEGSATIYHSPPPVHWLNFAAEPVKDFFRHHVFVVENQAFLGSGLIATLFVGLLLLNAYRRRFWCRYLCPLGALLGVFAWRPALRRRVLQGDCNQCDLCGMRCHGAGAKEPGDQWIPSECLVCLNCTEACNCDALAFRWAFLWQKRPGEGGVDLSRRAAVGAAVGGVVALSFMRSNPQSRGTNPRNPTATFHPKLIRPPGARPEREFLERCTACGLCMKICESGGLQPAVTEAGLEGLWTPRLVPQIGSCHFTCNLCGQVCPTGAIEPLTLEAKQEVRIGLASFDTTRCIPYAYDRDCMVCEEHCPLPEKAIYFVEVEIQEQSGQTKTNKQPHVNPDLCIGCGECENKCVFKDRPAIRVASANETRHPRNQPILPPGEGFYGY